MQLVPPLATGTLIKRYKLFLADIQTVTGETLTVHCPNTGAMHGCCDPGSEVWYSESGNPKRKYPHTLEVVCSQHGRVGVNTARANRLVEEAIVSQQIVELAGYTGLKREARIPESTGRFDFLLTSAEQNCYVEVKNLTLSYGSGVGAFPDAVSARAVRHVNDLARCKADGDRAVLIFCVQHSGISQTTTADEVHAEYGIALRRAMEAGVEVLAYRWDIRRDAICVQARVPFASPSMPMPSETA